MKPYYDDGRGIVIYHADCREILPTLPKIDLVLTDPPYGVKGEQNSKNKASWSVSGVRRKNDYLSCVDSVEYVRTVVVPGFECALSKSERAIITPGNKCLTLYPMPDSFGSFWQPASVGLQPWGRADSQPIFYYGKFPRESRLILGQSLSWKLTESPEPNGHPCPKPFDAWIRLCGIGSLEGDTICDPFMGSGTTLRAVKDLGRKAIEFFLTMKNANIPKIAIENPTPHPYVIERVGMYQQRIQPWEFGEKATKAVCLWLKNLPPLMATIIETGANRNPECHKEPPGPERKKNRSRTYQGIANAMAQQWG